VLELAPASGSASKLALLISRTWTTAFYHTVAVESTKNVTFTKIDIIIEILIGVGIEARITGKGILNWNKGKFALMR
jgi:hypothetical protein